MSTMPLSQQLLRLNTDPATRYSLSSQAEALEAELVRERAATQYWYAEVTRLREELKNTETGGHLGD